MFDPQMLKNLSTTSPIEDIKAFIRVVQNLIEQHLIKLEKYKDVEQQIIDYNTINGVVNNKPDKGWISIGELKAMNQKMIEAITLEKWVEGFITAIEIITLVAK